MEGWSRDDVLRTTPALPWVMPSPNIPTLDSAIVYPGHGAVRRHQWRPRDEARRGRSSWSARRGCRPKRFAAALNARGLPGVHFRAGGVRADVPEARARRVRRLPDSRARSRGVPAGADRRGADRGDSRRRSGAVRVAAAAVRIRARQACRSTSSSGSPALRAGHRQRRLAPKSIAQTLAAPPTRHS